LKVVLDTNVMISGVFFGGLPHQILRAWRDGHIKVCVSAEILEEYQQVAKILAKEHAAIDLTPILHFITQYAEVVSAAPLGEQVCVDCDDDKFLACALASGSGVVISGDKHLRYVSGYRGVEVLNPREFVQRYLAGLTTT
jgi:uncharacterized protein